MDATNRILIVDDHALFRGALREFLSHEPDFRVVGEAGNVREAIQSIGALTPHLVLTDLTMPGTRGIEAVTEIRRHHPKVKILVVSSHSEDEYRRRCRMAGAAGYIAKDTIRDELLSSIRAALGAGPCAEPEGAATPSGQYLPDRPSAGAAPRDLLH